MRCHALYRDTLTRLAMRAAAQPRHPVWLQIAAAVVGGCIGAAIVLTWTL